MNFKNFSDAAMVSIQYFLADNWSELRVYRFK
ncbi:Hypoticical protein [Pectobacterium parmentieri]|uniref:Hypoticical protein n=1 Tax=Pectobacterium parmentieri TaxID=1905730 RepID=A0A0H3HYP3_PECPM|nr:Hypoticical protein [Pectobacterium parmentieri]